MRNFSIQTKGLGKTYKSLNSKTLETPSLREDLAGFLRGSFLKKKEKPLPFWAVQNIDLEIKPGEVVGIIGPNGSGKSTLLKLFSRITEPTTGRIELYGRVGALLEVGTGFHIELTGRENIFLSGAILGMTRREIAKCFDEIVEFSEMSAFLDLPVKKYSSGMFLRLAFSVMAHLRTEIVIVDEVLAVGDASFQKKCLGKIENVAHQGRTVLYVSHQLETIAALCSRCLFMQKGQLIKDGNPREIIDAYYQSLKSKKTSRLQENPHRRGKGNLQFTDFWIENEKGEEIDILHSGHCYRFILSYEVFSSEELKNVELEIQIATAGNLHVSTLMFHGEKQQTIFKGKSKGQLVCEVARFPLNSGHFQCHLMARRGRGLTEEIEDFIPHAATFSVEPGQFYESGWIAPKEVIMLLDHSWRS